MSKVDERDLFARFGQNRGQDWLRTKDLPSPGCSELMRMELAPSLDEQVLQVGSQRLRKASVIGERLSARMEIGFFSAIGVMRQSGHHRNAGELHGAPEWIRGVRTRSCAMKAKANAAIRAPKRVLLNEWSRFYPGQ